VDSTIQRDVREARRQAATYPQQFQPFMDQFLMNGALIDRAGTEGWAYRTYQDLLLDLGTLRQQSYYVPDDPVFLLAEPQQCFYNAYNGCVELEGYTYVEGYAQTNMLVVQHAWLEDPEGTIVDPTWANHLTSDKDVIPTYYGIRFDNAFVIRRAFETGWCSILNREWSDRPDFPSLRFGFVTNDAGLVTGYKEAT
jgi:hypothetical protein